MPFLVRLGIGWVHNSSGVTEWRAYSPPKTGHFLLFIFYLLSSLLSCLLLPSSIFYLPSSLCSPSTVVLVSGVAVKRNRELLDGRWDKHDTKDAANIADLISQWVSADHPRLWSGHFGQGDRRPGQPLPLSKPEAGAQAGRIGSECRPERENLGFGDPGHFHLNPFSSP